MTEYTQNDKQPLFKEEGMSVAAWLKLLKKAGMDSMRIFLMVIGIRGGFNLILDIIKYKRLGINLKRVLNKDICNSALFFSNFVFTWKVLTKALPNYFNLSKDKIHFISGFLSGAFILWERKDRRISFSHQLSMRAMQALYANLYHKNLVRVPYGSALLFTLSTAQILYSYVMQYETLDPSIYKFMIKHALIPHSILQVNRKVVRENTLDKLHLIKLVNKMNVKKENLSLLSALQEDNLNLLPCQALHPNLVSCESTLLNRLKRVFKMIFPIYAGLTFLPAIFFRFPILKENPKWALKKCLYGTVRSSAFLAVLVASYQYSICNIRQVQLKYNFKDNKYIYYLAGILSGFLSIIIEKPSRREELALYTTPKAIDSFYHILYKKNWIFCIKHFESALFMISSALVMMYFKKEPNHLSPLLRWLLIRLVGKPTA